MIEDFARRVERCGALDDLACLLIDAGRDIGFDYVAMTFSDNLRQTAPRFAHYDNYPAVYAEVFVARRLYRIDPILHAAQRRIGGFAWAAVGDILPLRKSHGDILRRAAHEGLRDGYTVPANVPGEPYGAVSFASRRTRRLCAERRWLADAIARTAFEGSRRIRGLSVPRSPVPHLNAREIQCLLRLSMGEIDKEIARALRISPHTVRQYIKMIRMRYGAATRAEAVALALRDGQIGFWADAIPPFGRTD